MDYGSKAAEDEPQTQSSPDPQFTPSRPAGDDPHGPDDGNKDMIEMLIAAVLSAVAAPSGRVVLDCRTPKGRALVVAQGDTVAYRFVGPRGPDVGIVVPARSGRARRFSDRYAARYDQVRFVAEPWSYTVYSMDANPHTGSSAASGVVVRYGRRVVDDLPCRPCATWRDDPVLERLPVDRKEWSAMSAD